MYAVIALILVFTWLVGLSLHLLGGYVYIFLVGAVMALLAHYLGKEEAIYKS